MQATLAFRWHPAFEQRYLQLCEWFQVPVLSEEEIIGVIDGIYKLVPADLTGGFEFGGRREASGPDMREVLF